MTLYKFQELLHNLFNRYYINTKLILLKEQDVFIKEIGHCHNCTLSSKGYTPSSDFKVINVVYSVFHSVRSLLQYFRNKLNAYKMTIHGLLTQYARIIISEVKGRDSSLYLNTNDIKMIEISYFERFSCFGV